MTLHIIIGVLIGFVLYMLYSKRSQKVNLQSASNQNIQNHQLRNDSRNNKSNRTKKKSGGCCG